MPSLQFAPWSSDIELSFYSALASRKINHDKLDDAARKLLGRYEVQPGDAPERSARMQIHGNAFSTDELPTDHYRAEGILKNVNTIEEYRALASERTGIIKQAGTTIWDAIVDGTIYSCPSLLSSFYAIFFADLKKYKYTYHFAFPALHCTPAWEVAKDSSAIKPRLQPAESRLLYDAVQTWKYSVDPRQHGFFLAKRDRSIFSSDLSGKSNSQEQPSEPAQEAPPTPKTPTAASVGFQWTIASLSSYEAGFFDNVSQEDRFICFADPSNYPENPAWPLRNLLVLIKHRWQLQNVQILCYRDKHSTREHPNSVVLHLTSDRDDNIPENSTLNASNLKDDEMPRVTGWERDGNGKLTSRTIDLSAYMDPIKLADSAVDLNLKLMKWRIAPDLDLATISHTKCLLLGAGTLGSYVARNLLGWGVRHITFVDNGKVSFSNPVRQPLFRYEDCIGGGRVKAERAAEALREIYPGVKTEGITLNVPMAGHPIIGEDGETKVKAEYTRLKELIEAHDVIFLLMDTRESRWLPTVMGKSMGKIVLNTALGFDTYVVVRHGSQRSIHPFESPSPEVSTSHTDSQSSESEQHGESLGCYFCNDVVAPADSVKDQTLDQQCTVTRPGIAALASALSVELLISLLQHPLRACAPAPATRAAARNPPHHPLGLIPHSIRGFLASWDNILTKGPAYDCCSACSPRVIARYETDGWAFVKRAISEPGWIEEVSGLKEVQRRAEEAAAELEVDLSEVDEVDEGQGEGELI